MCFTVFFLADDEDEEIFGDFEDLETGEVATESEKVDLKKDNKSELKDEKTNLEDLAEKKRKLKQSFDAEYDEGSKFYNDLKEELNLQSQLNKNEFDRLDDSSRVQFEGFRPGMYVRMEFEATPCEFVENFDSTYPCLVGGLLNGEENVGCVQV